MKKNALALSVAAVALALSTAASAGQAGTPYIGGHLGLVHADWSGSNAAAVDIDEKSGTGIGVFAGYNFSEYFAVEAAYNFFDRFSVKEKTTGAGHDLDINGPELAVRLNMPVNESFEFYGRAGVMYAMGEISGGPDSNKLVPTAGLGVQFNIDQNIGVRFGYNRYFGVWDAGSNIDSGVDMDIDSVYLGFQYTFGGKTAPEPAPTVTRTVTTSYTLDANTLFGFDSAALTAEGAAAVDAVVNETREAQMTNAKFVVSGFTDTLGNEAYNQKLSERRAKTVADELVNKGVSSADITYIGHGESDTFTGSSCDNLKKADKIKCLAPERRVEISVTGDVSSTEEVQQ